MLERPPPLSQTLSVSGVVVRESHSACGA